MWDGEQTRRREFDNSGMIGSGTHVLSKQRKKSYFKERRPLVKMYSVERLSPMWIAIEMSITMVRNGAGPGEEGSSSLAKEPNVIVAGISRRTSPPALREGHLVTTKGN